jgi:hypothetical protein
MEQMLNKASEQKVWRAIISASETVQPGAQILANTNGGAFTVTLPASPTAGQMKFLSLTKDMILTLTH